MLSTILLLSIIVGNMAAILQITDYLEYSLDLIYS